MAAILFIERDAFARDKCVSLARWSTRLDQAIPSKSKWQKGGSIPGFATALLLLAAVAGLV
jgi:hypothetical protein